jgi:DNA polymerase-3 subunit delta
VYFGPFIDVKALRSTLRFVLRTFPIATCPKPVEKQKICQKYQYKLCSAPCAGKISKEYYHERIEQINKLFSGDRDSLLNELYKNIDRGSISPVYFFVGEEDALIDDALAGLEKKIFVPQGSAAFNRDVIMACTGEGERIVGLARAFPVLAKRRLVVVREADALNQQDWDSLTPYLKNPPLSTCLVFIMGEAPSFASPDNIVDFSVEDESEINDFLLKELSIRGKKIVPRAKDLLLSMAWNSLQELRQEIEKLSIYVGEKQTIDIDDLNRLCSVRIEVGAFALTDALGNRDAQAALRNLEALIDSGENEIGILARLANHFRRLIVTRSILENGGTVYDVPWEAVSVEGEKTLEGYEVLEYQVVLRGRRRE